MKKRFTRPLGLKTRACFLRVQGQGKRFRGAHILVVVAPHTGNSRIGYTVSRRVGNAVVRNRVRRRLKEIVRQSIIGLAPQIDYVVIAHPSAAQQSFAVLQLELLCLLKRITSRHPGQRSRPESCSVASRSTG